MKKSLQAAATTEAPGHSLANLVEPIEQRFGPLEHWPIERLLPYADNPRKHPERQLVQLTASIREFGFVMPALVAESGEIICGHARLEAARRLGMTEVPIIVARCWSKAQIRAYRLADNRLSELGSWDAKLLRIEIASVVEVAEVPVEVMGWSTGEIDVILDGVVDGEDDEADLALAAPVHPVARGGDLWLLGKNRLLCGSCLEAENWVRLMAGQVAAMSLNDPPWNVPVNGHVSSSGRFEEFAMASGEMTSEQFVAFNASWFGHVSNHVKDGAIVMAFIDHAHLYELMTASRQARLNHVTLCVWAKTNAGLGGTWRSQCEFVLVLKHGSAPHTNAVELGKHGRHRTTLWTHAGANAFGASRNADLSDHPTVKPKKLLAEAIRDVTRQGEIVIDAFSGSGSTILACEQSKRVGYAIEIEPRYIDVAIRRWEAATGKQAVLVDGGRTFAETREDRAVPA